METEAIIGRVNESDERMKELYVTDDEARAIIGNKEILLHLIQASLTSFYGVYDGGKYTYIHFFQIQSLVMRKNVL